MMVVARVEGDPGPSELASRLVAAVRDNEAYVVAARADREERHRTQSIRAEQVGPTLLHCPMSNINHSCKIFFHVIFFDMFLDISSRTLPSLKR
jgi:hypothetical protein